MISMKISALLVFTGASEKVWLKTMRAPALRRSSGSSLERGGFLAGFETWGAGPGALRCPWMSDRARARPLYKKKH